MSRLVIDLPKMSRFNGKGPKEDMTQARANLDNVLQNITELKDVSPLGSGDESTKPRDHLISDNESSPRKRSAAKKRKKPVGETSQSLSTTVSNLSNANSHVVTLFERSVDLAGYPEGCPLYSICRSWVRNSASDQQIIEQPKSSPSKRDGSPIELAAPVCNVGENLSDIRIPTPIKQEASPLDIHAPPQDAKELLIKHLAHWKTVRESWKQASNKYEERYTESFSIIKQLQEVAASTP